MNLNPIKANMTELETNGGLTTLFSYKTPVACRWTNGQTNTYYCTTKFWSKTTTRHVNQWLNGSNGINQPQEYFDNLMREVT